MYGKGHEQGTRRQRQPTGQLPWYATIAAENLARVEREWQERQQTTKALRECTK